MSGTSFSKLIYLKEIDFGNHLEFAHIWAVFGPKNISVFYMQSLFTNIFEIFKHSKSVCLTSGEGRTLTICEPMSNSKLQ